MPLAIRRAHIGCLQVPELRHAIQIEHHAPWRCTACRNRPDITAEAHRNWAARRDDVELLQPRGGKIGGVVDQQAEHRRQVGVPGERVIVVGPVAEVVEHEHHPLDVRLHDDARGDAELEVAREALPAEAAAAQADRGDGNAGEVARERGVVDNAGAGAREGPVRVVLQRRVEYPGGRRRLRLRRRRRGGGGGEEHQQQPEETGADQEDVHSSGGAQYSGLGAEQPPAQVKSERFRHLWPPLLGLACAEDSPPPAPSWNQTRTGLGAAKAGIRCTDAHLRPAGTKPRTGPRKQQQGERARRWRGRKRGQVDRTDRAESYSCKTWMAAANREERSNATQMEQSGGGRERMRCD
uniref:Uncharacterized protein n=1 Tax=Zea mays TaxID=4577 RepID=C0PDZ0_MAIZE|nr:unknown [Zea mays]ACN36163.1 unknown [Zea mays]